MNRFSQPTLATVRFLTSTAFFFVGVFVLFQLSTATRAEACRDCPFPMSTLHWRLPSGNSDVTVEEINRGSGRVQSVVRLLDAHTGELLAIGRLEHTKGRRHLRVELFDMSGGRMEAHLSYEDANRTKVRIRITCQSCNLDASYLN